MPYASKAQQRLFHSKRNLKPLAAEWDAATKAAPGGFAALPERAPGRRAQTKHFHPRARARLQK
jgi:hypothetical protein